VSNPSPCSHPAGFGFAHSGVNGPNHLRGSFRQDLNSPGVYPFSIPVGSGPFVTGGEQGEVGRDVQQPIATTKDTYTLQLRRDLVGDAGTAMLAHEGQKFISCFTQEDAVETARQGLVAKQDIAAVIAAICSEQPPPVSGQDDTARCERRGGGMKKSKQARLRESDCVRTPTLPDDGRFFGHRG